MKHLSLLAVIGTCLALHLFHAVIANQFCKVFSAEPGCSHDENECSGSANEDRLLLPAENFHSDVCWANNFTTQIRRKPPSALRKAAVVGICNGDNKQHRIYYHELKLDSPIYKDLVRECQEQQYIGSIFVRQHFSALFSPWEADTPSYCPMLAYQLIFDDYNNRQDGKVVVDVFCNVDRFYRRFPLEQSFRTGNYTLDQIAQAIDAAAAKATQKGSWDLFYNSCFHFALQLAVALDWDIDNIGMLPYISKRLLQHHSTSNIQKAIGTASFVTHFFNRGPVVQQTLQAYFGSHGYLSNDDFESSIFIEKLQTGGSDPKMQKALAVFYDELVNFYANSFVRPVKTK